ncbi:MAG: primosomal protein N' [Oligoflexia bacterium]|nr:primosomal protein N' [Oligoflexia bacterium]
MPDNIYYQVAVNYPSQNSILTYIGDPSSDINFQIGQLVHIPLGKRSEFGCVVDTINEVKDNPDITYKNIFSIVDSKIFLSPTDLMLFKWVSKYYHYGLGKLIFDTLPNLPKLPILSNLSNLSTSSALPKKRSTRLVKSPITPQRQIDQQSSTKETYNLTQIQQQIFDQLHLLSSSTPTNNQTQHFKALIHGVTGSGKSIIYLKLMEECFKKNQSVLFLLPEINLTPQFIEIFERDLTVPIYPYHSGLSDKQKLLIWESLLISNDSPKLIIGARSAIFLPIKNLGLIIMDEEHDHSYKQDDRCSYHARDVAYKKAKLLNIPIILGSATPSLESFYFFKLSTNKDFGHYFELRERVHQAQLPDIEIVDTRIKNKDANKDANTNTKKQYAHWPLTDTTIHEIDKNLQSGGQVLILINRLGFANYFQCKSCGHSFECVNCSTKLRFFSKKNILSCQYCNYTIHAPTFCPLCNCLDILQKGFGTEKIQAVLSELFPNKITERFDRDEITTITKLNNRLEAFHQHRIDILVGTQMLSKGHNFKRVRLVVILGVDSYLNYSDFRINEKVYQLLTQVAGRSGRFGGESKVLIQTCNPANETLNVIKQNLFDHFYFSEAKVRTDCFFPPFSRSALIYLLSTDQKQVAKHIQALSLFTTNIKNKYFASIEILGPKPAIIEKRVGFYTWCILLRTHNSKVNDLHNLITTIEENFELPSQIKMKIDIDPLTFM